MPSQRRAPASKERKRNYLILKSLRLTRPGGIVAVLTARYALDADNPAVALGLSDELNRPNTLDGIRTVIHSSKALPRGRLSAVSSA